MSGDSSRKPSGSSTHSGTHSPPSASGNPQRKIPSGPTTNMFGMGGGNGLKALNTGWQVWGSATTPSSKRNASMSSVASVGGEMPPSQVDSNFRSNLGETWSASRSTSGAWDDNAQKKDFSPLESQAMNLRHPRHRQSHAAFSAPRTDDRSSTPKTHPLHLGQESNPSRYSSSAKALGTGAYPGQQPSYPLSTGPGYDSLQVSAPGESDITLAMRGMAVEDDFNALQSRHHGQAPSTAQVSNSNIRGSSSLPQQRYNTYPTTEYGFYSPGPTRDSFFDYSYVGYGTPDPSAYGSSGLPVSANIYSGVPQSLHPNTVDIRQQQPGVYFDYSAGARPPSQFFFPPRL
ncbi:hypothetical protein B0H10DRAFT_856887 [Mycena sp. CBHHK59/15]|nr:hypothetical protein B0H10DRAFT_856887 [Mycena sp. CBHHK59/15]